MKKLNKDLFSDMPIVPFENNFLPNLKDDYYNLMSTSKNMFYRVYNYLKRTNREKIDEFWLKALYKGHRNIVKMFIEVGEDMNKQDTNYGRTGLVLASQEGHREIVKMFIEMGADVNKQDESGYTALMYASMYASKEDYREIIKMLIEAGADVNKQDTLLGRTALMYVSTHDDHAEIVEMFIKAGADVNKQATLLGYTALMFASEGHTEIAKILIKADADVNKKALNPRGWTALRFASEDGSTDIVEMLIEAGAKQN